MPNFRTLLILFLLTISLLAHSQKPAFPFGEISRNDLEMRTYPSDPDASAVILSDLGKATLVLIGNSFAIEFERNVKIKIINSQGFDYANIEIPYATGDKLQRVKATTYNLINDSIVEVPVNKKEFILDKSNKYWKTLRIAFPNVSEGSVIEYQYKLITNDIYNFINWNFQDEIPTHYSDYTAIWNGFFNFSGIIKGDSKSISKASTPKTIFVGDYQTTGWEHRWVATRIPAFKNEPFITGKNDHLIRLEFELIGTMFPGKSYEVLTPSYSDLPNKMMERSNFGLALKKASFLLKPTKEITKDCTDDLSKLTAIHRHVSNELIWDGKSRYGVNDPLKLVYKKKRGNSAEINLILIAMLQHAGLNVHPVILSTRPNGLLHPTIAMIHKFNYVVAQVEIGGKTYLVDATDPLLPFNNLPFYCLNGSGRLINEKKSVWVDLSNGERSISFYNAEIELDKFGTVWGKVNNSYGGFDAYGLRKFIKLESLKGYKDLLQASNPNWNIRGVEIENLDSLTAYINESFKIKIEKGAQVTDNSMIIDPFVFLTNESNPFSSEERKYAIDFGCPDQIVYNISIAIPRGYEVEELPKSVSFSLPKKAGAYIMVCEQKDGMIKIQSRLNINQTTFQPDDFITLREFYAKVSQMQSELIVFKKI